jgi:SNF2 family DNA or RNA helicase
VEGVSYGTLHHYSILADEPGLGKSPQALFVSEKASKVIIVCPAYLRENWACEIEKFLGRTDVQVFRKSSEFNKVRDDVKYYICSYHMFDLAESFIKDCDMVIADEAHALKNLSAKLTEHFHRLIWNYKPDRLMLLTGTPIKNRVPEFYSLLALMSYSKHDTNGLRITDKYPTYEDFCDKFSNPIQRPIRTRYGVKYVTKYEGLRNKEELKTYLEGKYLRRKTDNVLKDLPTVIHKEVIISPVAQTKLQKAWEDYTSSGSGSIPPSISSMKADNAIFKAEFTADYAIGLFEEISEPIVIFSDHVQPLRIIFEKIELKGYRVEIIDGSVPTTLRDVLVKRFQNGEIDFLLCSIGAASTGFTMTKANHMIINDLSWVPADNAQARKRIHRIGQTRPCTYHYIFGSKVDRMIGNQLVKKEVVLQEF